MALKIEATTFESPTSNGNQDVTIGGFGTVSAAMILGINSENGTVETIGTAYDGLGLMVSFMDGTNSRSMAMASGHNVGTTDTSRSLQSLAVDQISETSGTALGTATATFIANGVRLAWGDTPEAHRYILVLIGGTDVTNVAVGTISNNTSHNLGFRPDVVLAGTHGDSLTTRTGIAIQSFGAAVDDGANTERLTVVDSVDGAAAGDPDVYVDTGDSLSQLFSGTQNWAANITIDADGFDTDNVMGGDDGIYLAIKGIANISLATYTTPTSTGNDVITGVGFQPDFLLMSLTNAASIDAVESNNVFGVMYGIADGTNEWCANVAEEQGADPTNNQSKITASIVDLPDDNGAQLCVGALASFDADGFTINYSTADGAARKGWVLSIAGAAGTDYDLTAPDAVDFLDANSNIIDLILTAPDVVDFSDVASNIIDLLVTAPDGVKLSDVDSHLIDLLITSPDGIELSDANSNLIDLLLTTTEGVELSDVAGSIVDYVLTHIDGVSLNDIFTSVEGVTFDLTAADGINLSDIFVSTEVDDGMFILFSLRKGAIRLTLKKPVINFTEQKPDIDFTKET